MIFSAAKRLGFSKQEWSWAFYDWANSSFATTVMAGFFQVFFREFWSLGEDSSHTTARLGFSISLAGLSIALLSPTLGVLSDVLSSKKRFLAIAMVIGCLGCVGLGFLQAGQWLAASVIYGLSLVAFTASCGFSDSLMGSVVGGERVHKVSVLGYSLGYLGGGILFLIQVLVYLNPQSFGLQNGVEAIQLAFISVGLWWFLFSVPLLVWVDERKGTSGSHEKSFSLGVNQPLKQKLIFSFQGILKTLRDIWAYPKLRYFLLAYWLYIDGVYTVMTMAVDYGLALGLEAKDLIQALLITQFVGFPATLAYSRFLNQGPLRPLLSCIGVYCLSVIFATQMTEGHHFMMLAATLGLVQGGVQSLSRSLFLQLIPVDRSGEFFGFFNLVGKFASVLGPLLVATGSLWFAEARFGILVLLLVFSLGAFFLWRSSRQIQA